MVADQTGVALPTTDTLVSGNTATTLYDVAPAEKCADEFTWSADSADTDMMTSTLHGSPTRYTIAGKYNKLHSQLPRVDDKVMHARIALEVRRSTDAKRLCRLKSMARGTGPGTYVTRHSTNLNASHRV